METHFKENDILAYFQQELNALAEQIQLIENNILQLKMSADSINALKNSSDEEILMPLSNGIYYKTKTQNVKSLIINVGQNILIEKDNDEVIKLLNEKINEFEDTHQKVVQQYYETANMLNEIQKKKNKE